MPKINYFKKRRSGAGIEFIVNVKPPWFYYINKQTAHTFKLYDSAANAVAPAIAVTAAVAAAFWE